MKLIKFFCIILAFLVSINLAKVKTEDKGHCELRQIFVAVICDVLKTKASCEKVNGCIWIDDKEL